MVGSAANVKENKNSNDTGKGKRETFGGLDIVVVTDGEFLHQLRGVRHRVGCVVGCARLAGRLSNVTLTCETD